MEQQLQVRQPTKLDVFFGQVMTDESRAELKACLPEQVPLARFERNLKNALMQNAKLLDLQPHLVWREVAKAASLGLLLDPILGEAAIVISFNGRANREEPQLRTMVRGLQKLARQSGEVALFYSHEVCQNDEFRCELGTAKNLVHNADVFGNRGPVIGYYAVVKYTNGEDDFEPMSQQQVADIRDRSDSWKAYKANRIKDTPWASSHDEMAKKTVMRRLMKRMPQSPDVEHVLAKEDQVEFPDPIDITPQRPTYVPPEAPPRPSLQRPVRRDVTEEMMAAVQEATEPEDIVLQVLEQAPLGAAPAAPSPDAPPAVRGERPAHSTTRTLEDLEAEMGGVLQGEPVPPPKPSTPPPASAHQAAFPFSIPALRVYPLAGSRGLDWEKFRADVITVANSLPNEAVDAVILKYKDELRTMQKQSAVLHKKLIDWLEDRRVGVVSP